MHVVRLLYLISLTLSQHTMPKDLKTSNFYSRVFTYVPTRALTHVSAFFLSIFSFGYRKITLIISRISYICRVCRISLASAISFVLGVLGVYGVYGVSFILIVFGSIVGFASFAPNSFAFLSPEDNGGIDHSYDATNNFLQASRADSGDRSRSIQSSGTKTQTQYDDTVANGTSGKNIAIMMSSLDDKEIEHQSKSNVYFTNDGSGFTLASKNIENGDFLNADQIADSFGCDGKNLSPQLSWKNAPTGTKSFLITMRDKTLQDEFAADKEARKNKKGGEPWFHWIVTNIPPTVSSFTSGAGELYNVNISNRSSQVITSFGTVGYTGPCPQANDTRIHEYVITIYAMGKEKLLLTFDSNPDVVLFYIKKYALAEASIIARYKR